MEEIKKTKKIIELNKKFNNLKKDKNEFLSNLTKDRTTFIFKKINDKDHYIPNVKNKEITNCLNGWYKYEGTTAEDEEYKIINYCDCIENEIKQYEIYIRNINENYEDIKKNMGIKVIQKDTSELKKMISKTHDKLIVLMNTYKWVM